jgi:transposase
MLAEVVDAVVGVDTHRDAHEVEIASPNGVPIAQCSIRNGSTGYAQLLAWIVDHAPGPQLVVSIEGSRSYGVGLSRALTAAGLQVLESEQPARSTRHGKDKSDAIDAHLAVLAVLRLDTDRLPLPRVDGDREALRILLGARHDLTVAFTAQTNRLRALLLGSDHDADRNLARGVLSDAVLTELARRQPRNDANREQAVRHGEIRRLALAVRDGGRALKDNRVQLQLIVADMAPGLTERRGVGPVTAAQVIVSFSHPGAAAATPRSPLCRAPARYRPAAAAPFGTGSTAAATER